MTKSLPQSWRSLLFGAVAAVACPALVQAQAITLPYTQDFEAAPAATIYTANTANIGFLASPGVTVDYEQLLTGGRARFDAFANNGTRGCTFDDVGTQTPSNFLVFEMDMSNYSAASDLELGFAYNDHGDENHNNDRVWVRGSNVDPWIEIYDLFPTSVSGWQIIANLDVDMILAANGQSPSATFGMRFGQEDNSSATSLTALDGITFDDIVLTGTIPVDNNATLSAILSPTSGCEGLYDIEVVVCNVGLLDLNNIPVSVNFGGTILSGTVPGPLSATECDTVVIGDTLLAGSSTGMPYWMTGWTALGTDQDLTNDTVDTVNIEIYGNTNTTVEVSTNDAINNTLAPVQSGVYVCGQPVLDSCFVVTELYIDTLFHTFNGDLDIFLISPSGTAMEISTDNGGGSDDMIHVAFNRSAVTPIVGANPIPAGSYIPEEANGFDIFSGEDPNGEWILQITDDAGGDNGTLIRWSMSFANTRVDLGLDTTSCAGSYTINPGSQFATYAWSDGSTNQTLNVTDPGTHVYAVTTTDPSGLCTSTDMISVSIGHSLDLGPDQSLCAGSTFTFELGDAYVSGTWQDGSTGLTYTSSSVETIIATATDSLGCMDTDTTLLDEVFPVTPIDLGEDQDLCEGEFATIQAPTGFAAYEWNGSPGGSEFFAFNSNTYTVVATDANNCTSTDDVVVVINPLPNLPIGLNGGPSDAFSKLPGEVVNFFIPVYPSMIWSVNGDASNSGVFNNTETLSVTTNLYGFTVEVFVEDDNGCENEREVKVFNYPLSTGNEIENGTISVYPNPSKGTFFLRNMSAGERVEIQVVDMQGRIVLQQAPQMLERGSETALGLSNTTSGIYLLNLTKESGTMQVRLVVE